MKFYFTLSNELSNELSKEKEKCRVTVLNSCSVIFCSQVANRLIGQTTITLPTEAKATEVRIREVSLELGYLGTWSIYRTILWKEGKHIFTHKVCFMHLECNIIEIEERECWFTSHEITSVFIDIGCRNVNKVNAKHLWKWWKIQSAQYPSRSL